MSSGIACVGMLTLAVKRVALPQACPSLEVEAASHRGASARSWHCKLIQAIWTCSLRTFRKRGSRGIHVRDADVGRDLDADDLGDPIDLGSRLHLALTGAVGARRLPRRSASPRREPTQSRKLATAWVKQTTSPLPVGLGIDPAGHSVVAGKRLLLTSMSRSTRDRCRSFVGPSAWVGIIPRRCDGRSSPFKPVTAVRLDRLARSEIFPWTSAGSRTLQVGRSAAAGLLFLDESWLAGPQERKVEPSGEKLYAPAR